MTKGAAEEPIIEFPQRGKEKRVAEVGGRVPCKERGGDQCDASSSQAVTTRGAPPLSAAWSQWEVRGQWAIGDGLHSAAVLLARGQIESLSGRSLSLPQLRSAYSNCLLKFCFASFFEKHPLKAEWNNMIGPGGSLGSTSLSNPWTKSNK